jgi:hypothetical protein
MAHEITVQWDASPGPVSGYNIFRGTTSGNESNIPINGPTLVAGTSFVDNTVFPGTVYYYRIEAVLNGISSANSVEVKSAPVPFDPSPAVIDMGSAESFEILAGSTVTNVPSDATQVAGDVGVWPGTSITGFGAPSSISGVFHAGDFVAQAAQGALVTAYNSAAAALNPNGSPAIAMTGDIGGQTLPPGVYAVSSSLGITGTLVLDAQGDPKAAWIFQIGSTLVTAANNSSVVLAGGANADNVFWQVGSSATLGVGTNFAGTIMAKDSITANTGARVNGRLLAINGAVTLDGNSVVLFLSATLALNQRDHAFGLGTIIFDCVSSSFQQVIKAGITGSTLPTYSPIFGVITQDGTVTWISLDPPAVSVEVSLPPSGPNVPPAPPAAPLNPRITSEA